MAKESMKAREVKRAKLVAKYAAKRSIAIAVKPQLLAISGRSDQSNSRNRFD